MIKSSQEKTNGLGVPGAATVDVDIAMPPLMNLGSAARKRREREYVKARVKLRNATKSSKQQNEEAGGEESGESPRKRSGGQGRGNNGGGKKNNAGDDGKGEDEEEEEGEGEEEQEEEGEDEDEDEDDDDGEGEGEGGVGGAAEGGVGGAAEGAVIVEKNKKKKRTRSSKGKSVLRNPIQDKSGYKRKGRTQGRDDSKGSVVRGTVSIHRSKNVFKNRKVDASAETDEGGSKSGVEGSSKESLKNNASGVAVENDKAGKKKGGKGDEEDEGISKADAEGPSQKLVKESAKGAAVEKKRAGKKKSGAEDDEDEEDEEDEDGEGSRVKYRPGNIFCLTCNKYNTWEIDLGSAKKKWKNQYYERYCTVCGNIVSTVDQQRAKAAEKRKMQKRREPTRSSVNAYLKANMKIKGQKA